MEVSGAQSAYRVLDVLTEVSLNPGATASEVAAATNLTTPTAHRLLRVLCDRGFAVQNEAGKYIPGPQMRVLVGDRVDHAALEEIGRPLLAQLRDKTTETVFLAVREGLQLAYLIVLTSSHSVQMYGEVGQLIPLHATSQGKVVLAFLPSGVGDRIIDQLEMPRYTPATLTTAAELHEAMFDIRRDGYALNLQEREMGVLSVAAPVLDPSGNVVASVCVGGPIFRVTEDDLRGKFAELTCETAQAISAELLRRSNPVTPAALDTTGEGKTR
ncbi:IclR family transcriptional regulator [Mycolicibacterium mageritense DSM 44476 = CIP 104973]|uniref:IclR family transcriptional regulator n=4 Tax=Mycolicibacterium TaxID=1866885 RepID=A0AAI8TU57_MYCME|nr:IclR family transcriptional regulator [Mycolicibacterium mageritense]MBN3454958.1 IclR family transcriptional regulator [Mycobacterium sp. DSM 3803]OKH80654.1 IclR family transcriptional regulator [Mycobacterium sp. SWH-M3]MCC9180666.1 IclR family transcriptional regulator [Mycolicibacterium mageritense]TXI61343.1 MAG: IclR family transcriptional regulator [Mycolicibacterium mageritense]CDO23037.1 IclR family transcriptional regulator [Mycolicibacterium mageritense DSM 44476 = CIP 104973]